VLIKVTLGILGCVLFLLPFSFASSEKSGFLSSFLCVLLSFLAFTKLAQVYDFSQLFILPLVRLLSDPWRIMHRFEF